MSLQAYPGRNYVIDVSTNLAAWTKLMTIYQSGAAVQISDPGATNSPKRFYRAHLAP